MGIEEAVVFIAAQEGREAGYRNSSITVIRNLLKDTDFNDKEIARLVGVSKKFVDDVRNKRVDLINDVAAEFKVLNYFK